MMWLRGLTLCALAGCVLTTGLAARADDADRIFDKSTVWRPLTPNDKLVVYGIDDPAVAGVACWYTQPEKGGIKGTLGLAEDVSDISLACRQVGPVQFKEKFKQGAVVFSERRSLIFKSMQIVRGCDVKRNTLIYMVYSDKVIQGSPKNSTSAVPLMPWGTEPPPKCDAFMEK
jgi:CreA protein